METKFTIFVTACDSKRLEHRNEHNYKVAKELARILSQEDTNGFVLNVHFCCEDKIVHHDNHYLVLKVPEKLVEKCLKITHKTVANINSVISSERARIQELSLRMISPSDKDISFLKSICDCQYSANKFNLQNRIPKEGESGCLVEFVNQGLLSLSCLDIISKPFIQHDKEQRKRVWFECTKPITLYPSIPDIRDYFGNNIAHYFSVLRVYCIMLLLLGSVSIFFFYLSFIHSYFFGEYDYGDPELSDILGKPLKPLTLPRIIYGILTIFWSLLLIKFWHREKTTVDYEWSKDSVQEDNMSKFIFSSYQTRPEYYGTWRRSNVDEELELHFLARYRRIRYFITAGIIIICLLFALVVNVALLNLEGFILNNRSPWLYIGFLSSWSASGELFDPNSDHYAAYIPGILHPLLIFIMNQIIFRNIAEKLTDFENHQTKEDYENALVIKRFLFEAIDAYGCLFYLGIVLTDWNSLQSMLNMMFATDSIRRILLEVIIPWVSYKMKSMKKDEITLKKKKNDEATSENTATNSDRKLLYADAYESFDDYLELVLQQGYLVLFATACPPFVAIAACVCSWIEAFSDLFKLCWVVQRPMPNKQPENNSIYTILFHVQSWIALSTNVLLLYSRGVINYETMFLLEHVLVIIALAVHYAIKDEPVHVKEAKRRDILLKMRQFNAW